MPVVFRERGFRFYFYSNEGDPREPIHIHVRSQGKEIKFWLYPEIKVAYNDGYDSRTQRELMGLVKLHRAEIERIWHEFFDSSDRSPFR